MTYKSLYCLTSVNHQVAKAASKVTGIEVEEDNVEDSDQKIRLVERLQKEMTSAAARLEFERAAKIRDRIIQLQNEIYN